MANRRMFLKAAVAAPVAVPVAAKDAAIKMGMGNAKIAGEGVALNSASGWGGLGGLADNELRWLQDELAEALGSDGSDHRYELKAGGIGRLDHDLAALRSVSPAWAETIQVERTVKRTRERRISNLQKRIAFRTKKSMGLG